MKLPVAIVWAPWWVTLLARLRACRLIRRCARCGRVVNEDMHLLRRCEDGCDRSDGFCARLVWS